AIATSILDFFHHYHQQSNKKTLYITGNHDYWDDGHLEANGFEVCHEYRLLNINSKKVLILHGDGLSDPKMGLPRPLFHRIIRNPYFVNWFKKCTSAQTGFFILRNFSRL